MGFAAGIAIGLINCGTAARGAQRVGRDDSVERLEELVRERLLPTLRETQHDRIAVGLAVGLALLFYDSHTHGAALLREMLADNNEHVRMSAVLGLGLAYVGQHQRRAILTE